MKLKKNQGTVENQTKQYKEATGKTKGEVLFINWNFLQGVILFHLTVY